MKKSTAILLIVASCLVIIGSLLAVAAVAIAPDGIRSVADVDLGIVSYSGQHDFDNAYAASGEYTTEASDRLYIDWTAGTVNVEHYAGSEIKLVETTDSGEAIEVDNALRYGVQNGTLYIQYSDSGTHKNMPFKALTVYLPEAALQSIEVHTASADVVLREIQCDRIQLRTASGEIDVTGQFSQITADTISGTIHAFHIIPEASDERAQWGHFNTVSGEIYVLGGYHQLSADSTSGDIHINGTIYELEASSTSGLVEFEGWANDIEVDTGSGEVTLDLRETPFELGVDTVSGDVTLLLPESTGFVLEYDSVSGDFDCALPVSYQKGEYVCGAGGAKFEIDTTSGDLKIGIN